MGRKANNSESMKRVFVLEDKKFSDTIRGDLEFYARVSPLIVSSTSKSEFRRHLPEGYDLYLLHISNTELEAIEELRSNQPESKIFIRTSIRENFVLPFNWRPFINGTYNITGHEYCKTVFESIKIGINLLVNFMVNKK